MIMFLPVAIGQHLSANVLRHDSPALEICQHLIEGSILGSLKILLADVLGQSLQ